MENTILLNTQKSTDALKDALLKLLPESGLLKTSIDGFSIARRNAPTEVLRCFYKPNIILMLQGTKHVIIGSQEYMYGENQCLITGVDLPSAGRITNATKERPSLGLTLELDEVLLTELAAKTPVPYDEVSEQESQLGLAVTETDPAVLDAFFRLTELVTNPEQQAVLAPMIIREIHYRLLSGHLGSQLRRIFTQGSKSNRIAQSIAWLRDNYVQPLTVNELAAQVNMAQSTFHRQFKHMTTISPLQYQKKLRLFEAQRLMLVENQDATNACYAVGYESPTQFNREYKRMFGEPPRKNIQRIRG